MNLLNNIISRINDLTYHELIHEIDKLGLENMPVYKFLPILPNGEKQWIYRARPTKGIKFDNIKQLSYNPWPNTFDRASTPCMPMFYGSISMHSNDYPMITNCSEVNQILRYDKLDNDEQEIAIAQFEATQEFSAAALIFCKEFLSKNAQYEKIYNQVKLASENDFRILEDFSYLFSYTEKDCFLDYRLTSCFVDYVLYSNPDIEAIIYPSARMKGEGTNVAINPLTVNTKLKLKRVVVTKIYMRDSHVINDYISKAEKINADGTFELIDIIGPPYHKGRNYCLAKLDEKINKSNKSI